jgi:hypothetical protein
MSTGTPIDELPALISAVEVGKLCGDKTFGWANWKMKTDPNFPRPLTGRNRRGAPKFLWRRTEIEAWWKAEQQGENASKPEKLPAFAGETAVQFIRGGFDPPHKQIDRRRRIERARLKGAKSIQTIHLTGDWK